MISEPVAALAHIRGHQRLNDRPELVRNHIHPRHRAILTGQRPINRETRPNRYDGSYTVPACRSRSSPAARSPQNTGSQRHDSSGWGEAPLEILPHADTRISGFSPAWHSRGMNRTRLSTTVDTVLLTEARKVHAGSTDAALVDDALRALLDRRRSAQIDASYVAYEAHPVDQPDEWGDLGSWRQAAGAS